MNFRLTRLLHALIWLAGFAIASAALFAQVTESPYTVAPGKFLVEMDGVKLSLDRAEPAGNKYTALAVASTVVTLGLTERWDFQVGFDFYHRETFEFRGVRDSHSGVGDLLFRAKWSFWRSESTGSALAIIPYVKVPSNSGGVGNDSVEGGFIVPFATTLGGWLNAGAMFQWDVVRNPADDGYDSQWLASAFVQRKLIFGLSLYGEANVQAASTGLSDWVGMLGVGAVWNFSRVQLDYEILRGLNRRATDWTHVLRVNWGW